MGDFGILTWPIGIAIYFFPTFVSLFRKDPTYWVVLLWNLTFGWTGLGWVLTLVWAATRDVKDQG